MKCYKSYTRHGNRYEAGKNYDKSSKAAKADEDYYGYQLWANATERNTSESTGKPAPKPKGRTGKSK